VTNESKPRGTSGIARFRPEMASENPADHVFVDLYTERQSDLLSNSLAPAAIASFHFDDRIDEFFRRASSTTVL
jgi:hypothetical protein